jgi:6-pyruvoyltetrahydropterin/6-carboxytetrahydropterin synthase
MQRLTTIEIDKEDLKFSAAHFTIFSRTDRERLHGHNFRVYIAVTAAVGPSGMCFSYKEVKQRIRKLCRELDEYTLIAADSPFMQISEDGDYYQVVFSGEKMFFLKSDTLLLPIVNTTVEEYSRYLLERVLQEEQFFNAADIRRLVVKVSSGPGQWGSASWDASA